MPAGAISKRVTWRAALLILLQFLLVTLILGYRSWKDSSYECVRCHSSKEELKRLNASWAYVTSEMAEKESNHPNVECRDCHLGDGRTKDKDRAHRGMLKMLIVGESGKLLPRKSGYPGPLRESGNNDMFALLPKIEIEGELYVLPEVRNILWHDRDTGTFGFDPRIAAKTCSKSGCHPEELKQFTRSIMGRNFRQRTMKTWLNPYGPHNCGPSFADIQPPEIHRKPDFSSVNTEEIITELNTPFSREHAEDKQRFCNVCHTGCLDCHYTPSKDKGTHAFTAKPSSLSCSGYGRGASICHPGSMASRRGETYIGGYYSLPQGMEPDVHFKKGIHCVDCHPAGERGMGDMERAATCQDCHIETEEAHNGSIHKDMDCATCHISRLGGYQITTWGPGTVAEKKNPFHKYSLYYGIQSPPVLMKDQKGRWMPVKVWPHSVGNIKVDVQASPSVQFRWPEGETRDAYYIVGTFDNLPDNNKHLLWVEIEQAAHPYQKSRTCDSCHRSERQELNSGWEFYDNDGAEPFTGSYRVIADEKGLRFIDIKNLSPINLLPGARLSDFAPWIYLGDRWVVPGDFSIKTDKNKYRKYKEMYDNITTNIKEIDPLSEGLSPVNLKRYRKARSRAIHNPDIANDAIRELRQIVNGNR